MTYSEFSTDNAEYKLILSMHLKKNKEDVKGLDAIVLEGIGGLSSTIRGGLFGNMYGRAQYLSIIKTAEKENITLYNGDVNPKILLAFAEILAAQNLYPLASSFIINYVILPGMIPPFFKGKTWPGITEYIAFPTWLMQGAIAELRNAVCARKTEEFIAPQLKERLGRKPKIGIVYGALHAGIKLDLKHKKMRDFTLWNHKHLNPWPYFGLTKKGKENLNTVEEADYQNERWVVKKHCLENLFP